MKTEIETILTFDEDRIIYDQTEALANLEEVLRRLIEVGLDEITIKTTPTLISCVVKPRKK